MINMLNICRSLLIKGEIELNVNKVISFDQTEHAYIQFIVKHM